MPATVADLDNLSDCLRCDAATAIAARRQQWGSMTTRQRRYITRTAVRQYRQWLKEHQQNGRRQHS